MSLSTRVSIQWLPSKVEETTKTYVFSSPKGLSIDVRIFEKCYPYVKLGKHTEPIEEVFEFVSIGSESPIKGTNKVEFPSELNLHMIVQAIKSGKRLEDCKGLHSDIGNFWPIEGSEDRKETGCMVNPATNKLTEYVEVWRSLNPVESTPSDEIREHHWTGKNKKELKTRVYDARGESYRGRLIMLNNWVQAVLYVCEKGQHQLSVARAYADKLSGKWEFLIDYGNYSFLELFKYSFEEDFECSDIFWYRIE